MKKFVKTFILIASITSIGNAAFTIQPLTQAPSIEQELITQLTTAAPQHHLGFIQEARIIGLLANIYQHCTQSCDPIKIGNTLNEIFIAAINSTSRKSFLEVLANYVAQFQHKQSQNVPIFKDVDNNFSTVNKLLYAKQHVAEVEQDFINNLTAITATENATLFCESLNTCLAYACTLYHDATPLNKPNVYAALNTALTKACTMAQTTSASAALTLLEVVEHYTTEIKNMPTLRGFESNLFTSTATLASQKNELALLININKTSMLTPAITFWNNWSVTKGELTNASLDTAYTTYQKKAPLNALMVYKTLNEFFSTALSFATTPDHYTALETYIKKFQNIPTLKIIGDGFATLAETYKETHLVTSLTAAAAVNDTEIFWKNWSTTSTLLDTIAASYNTTTPINTPALYAALRDLLTKALISAPSNMLTRLTSYITTFHELPIFKGNSTYNFSDVTKLYKAKRSEQNIIDKLTHATSYTEICNLLDTALTKTIFADDTLFNAVATAIYRTIDLITPSNYTTYQPVIDHYLAQATTKFNDDFGALRESLLYTALGTVAQITDRNTFWDGWNSSTPSSAPKLLENLYTTYASNKIYNPTDTYTALDVFFAHAISMATTHDQLLELSTHLSKFEQVPALIAIKDGFAKINTMVQEKMVGLETEENLIAKLTITKTFPELIQLLTQATSLQESYAPQKLASSFSSAFTAALTAATNLHDMNTLKTILDRALIVSTIANNLKTLTPAVADKQQAIAIEENLIANLTTKTTSIEIIPLLQLATKIKKAHNMQMLTAAFVSALSTAINAADNTADINTLRTILAAATHRECLNINQDTLVAEVTARYKAIDAEERLIAALSSRNTRADKISLLKQALNTPNPCNTTKLARAFETAFNAALTTATDADIIALQDVLASVQHIRYLNQSSISLATTLAQRQHIQETEALLISKLTDSTTLADLYTYLARAVAPSPVINIHDLGIAVATALNKAATLVTERNYTTEQPKVAHYITAAQSKFLDIKNLPIASSTPDRIFVENCNNLDTACTTFVSALNHAQGVAQKLPPSAQTPANIAFLYSSVAINKTLTHLNQALSALQKTPHYVLDSRTTNTTIKKTCTHIMNSINTTFSALVTDQNIVGNDRQQLKMPLFKAALQNMQKVAQQFSSDDTCTMTYLKF
jgi:hypothetical protein